MKLSHFHRCPAGDDGLAPPFQRLLHIRGFQDPKSPDVLNDEMVAAGVRVFVGGLQSNIAAWLLL